MTKSVKNNKPKQPKKQTDKDIIKALNKDLELLNESILNIQKENERLEEKLAEQRIKIGIQQSDINKLHRDYDYLKMTMEATKNMLNYAKGQVNVYEKITDTQEVAERLCDKHLSCNHCNG